ncbi:hypothetical protein [Pseudomonas sp. BMS12]|uniref:hypothetical protein n=1 Tax=Pseudomonas sp. BMS12 TaxID=1796033 RepID=UPI00083A9727|nr:hypothetical protein [Pseudomonas sp. BMS12]
MRPLLSAALLLATTLAGCAGQVQTNASSGELELSKQARRHLLVHIDGSPSAKADPRWQEMESAMRSHLDRQVFNALYQVTFVGERRSIAQQPGLMVEVQISDFNYQEQLPRYFLGPATSEAWVGTQVSLYDLQSGRQLGSRSYRSSSSGWGGVFSAMSEKQIQAMSKRIVQDIRQAEEAPLLGKAVVMAD